MATINQDRMRANTEGNLAKLEQVKALLIEVAATNRRIGVTHALETVAGEIAHLEVQIRILDENNGRTVVVPDGIVDIGGDGDA